MNGALLKPRTAARVRAVQALYQLDFGGTAERVVAEFREHRMGGAEDDSGPPVADPELFAALVRGVVARQPDIDALLAPVLAEGWSLARIDHLLRGILRAGVFELLAEPNVPVRVVISEYVDVARSFFSGPEPGVVNGILDRLGRRLRAAEFGDGTDEGDAGNRRRSEFQLIAEVFAPLARDYPLAFDLTDDVALIRPEEGSDVAVTTDALVAGIHFPADEDPALVARKALRVNLSDLAGKGARPLGYLLALSLPRDLPERWIEGFAGGLALDQARFGVPLIGGDTTATDGPLTLAITMFGTLPRGTMPRRGGARPGDRILVSGTIGDALLGLQIALGQRSVADPAARAALLERFRLPAPRLALGDRLRGVASASLDVSDGLVADIGHICEVSGVAATLFAAAVPLSPAARAQLETEPALLADLLSGGDDYEIAFTVPPQHDIAALAGAGVAVTEIGVVAAGAGLRVLGPGGEPLDLARRGYQHR